MAINVSALTAYVEEQRLPLIRKTIFAAPSVKHFNLQTGVKHSAALNILNTSVAFGDGATCGWDEAGTSAFSQRVLEVGNYKVNMSFCDRAMLKYWNGYEVRVAAGQKSLPFEEEFVEGVISDIKDKMERNIWQGVKATDRMDGILTILAGEQSVIKPTVAQGATAYDKALAAYKAIPAAKLDKAAIFMGVDEFRDLVLELTSKNLYHYDPANNAETLSYKLPGSNVIVEGVEGLDGADKEYIIGGRLSNLFVGVDLEGDTDTFDFWYSKDDRIFKLAIEFALATQVAFPDEIILGKITK